MQLWTALFGLLLILTRRHLGSDYDPMLRRLSLQLPLAALLILTPVCARPTELYQMHRLSEQELVRTYTGMLLEARRHADQFWTNSPHDPAAGYWGNGLQRRQRRHPRHRRNGADLRHTPQILQCLDRQRTPGLPEPGHRGDSLCRRHPPYRRAKVRQRQTMGRQLAIGDVDGHARLWRVADLGRFGCRPAPGCRTGGGVGSRPLSRRPPALRSLAGYQGGRKRLEPDLHRAGR